MQDGLTVTYQNLKCTFRSGFLNLGTCDLLGPTVFCPVLCRTPSKTPTIYPFDVNSICTLTVTATRHCQISPGVQNRLPSRSTGWGILLLRNIHSKLSGLKCQLMCSWYWNLDSAHLGSSLISLHLLCGTAGAGLSWDPKMAGSSLSAVSRGFFPHTWSVGMSRKWRHNHPSMWFLQWGSWVLTWHLGLPRAQKWKLLGFLKTVAYSQPSNFSTFLYKMKNLSRKFLDCYDFF